MRHQNQSARQYFPGRLSVELPLIVCSFIEQNSFGQASLMHWRACATMIVVRFESSHSHSPIQNANLSYKFPETSKSNWATMYVLCVDNETKRTAMGKSALMKLSSLKMEIQFLPLDSATLYSRFRTKWLKSGQRKFAVQRTRRSFADAYSKSDIVFQNGSLLDQIGKESSAHDLFREIMIVFRHSTCHGRLEIDLADTHSSCETWYCIHAPTICWWNKGCLTMCREHNTSLPSDNDSKSRFLLGKFGWTLTHTNQPFWKGTVRWRYVWGNVAHSAHRTHTLHLIWIEFWCHCTPSAINTIAKKWRQTECAQFMLNWSGAEQIITQFYSIRIHSIVLNRIYEPVCTMQT